MFFKTHRAIGNKAEDMARKYLEQQALSLVSQNYSTRYGEIDLIMQDKDTVVFIEVRYRKQSIYGSTADTITQSKQHKIIITAQHFLTRKGWHHKPCRFDVVLITKQNNGRITLEWLKNAFCCR